MAKRRKSRSAAALGSGAAGCGPAGFVVICLVIWVVSKYWVIILIALGVIALIVAMIVALVKVGRTPPSEVTQQPQEPPRPPAPVQAPEPKPKPVRRPKSVPTPKPNLLAADELAVQMRAFKHASHVQAMQEWDREWILLAHPEKTSREISEITNAHFARGLSIGVNHGDPSVPGFKASKPRKDLP